MSWRELVLIWPAAGAIALVSTFALRPVPFHGGFFGGGARAILFLKNWKDVVRVLALFVPLCLLLGPVALWVDIGVRRAFRRHPEGFIECDDDDPDRVE